VQAWTGDDKLIVGTDHGDILVIEGSELKVNLNKVQTELSCVESLCVYTKGFVVGCDDGVITLFEKTDDRDLYVRSSFLYFCCCNEIGARVCRSIFCFVTI